MHLDHRRRLLERLSAERTAAVLPTATEKVRNHDSHYRFRPDSDFWYLTGFGEPEACLVLLPELKGDGPGKCVLFLRERDKEKEIWNGRRLGVEAAPEALGVDEARPISALWDDLPDLLAGYERILWRFGLDEDRDRRLVGTVNVLCGRARLGIRPPVELIDPLPLIHEQRLIKTEPELERIRAAAAITAEAHLSAMRVAAPGVNERELDALLDYTFRRRGGDGPAYTSIVAGGANACILHYIENDAPLADGELCLIDAGAEYGHYAADVTRTFPVSGRFSEPQRALYELVLAAQEAAIDAVQPGASVGSVHDVTVDVLVRGLIELGLCEGSREEVLESNTYKAFFMHKTGHWVGLDVHDCGYYNTPDGQSRLLEPGMVLTIEPGLYVDAENQEVEERWRGIGVRIEDDVLVTEGGNEVITAAIPKSLEAVEEACSAAE